MVMVVGWGGGNGNVSAVSEDASKAHFRFQPLSISVQNGDTTPSRG